MNLKIRNLFLRVVADSLHTRQINYLGQLLDRKFDVYKMSGFGLTIPVPQQTAAETLLLYFKEEQEIIDLFTILLRNEGKIFRNNVLKILYCDKFLSLLNNSKWIYDWELEQFFLDPFYEHEINFLKNIRILDLRKRFPLKTTINKINKISKKLCVQDLEWRINLRLYDLTPGITELIRKVIELLLVRQNMQNFSYEMLTCLIELAINASKANYKILFEEFVTRKKGITTNKNYEIFLDLFKKEIEDNGNRRLFELAKKEDKYINITFQSSINTVEIWVTNNQNISLIEKKQIAKRLGQGQLQDRMNNFDIESYTEGAGLGINIILSILKKYSNDPNPLKVIFYPEYIKIGFKIKRSDMLQNM